MSAQRDDSQAVVLAEYQAIGAHFILPIEALAERLGNCQAIVFDWDGVFNAGRKDQLVKSDFAEADSMGANMLRYGLWRKLGKLPYTAIISGENNDNAIQFAKREHLNSVFTGVQNKRVVIDQLCDDEGLSPGEIVCVFDDINDLSMADSCGLRLMVRRNASPLLAEYVARRALCDYVSGTESGGYVVREICELLLGLLGSYDQVLDSRVAYDDNYQTYLQLRQAVVTELFIKGEAGTPA